jgi:signal peptidase I
MPKSARAEIREWIEALALAVIIAVVIRTFFLGVNVVDGPSMQPNLWTGERVMVDKVSYHFHLPKPGDVVVFDRPNPEPDYIKRVIALPGDTIAIHDNQVIVNGQVIDEPYLGYATVGEYPETQVPMGCVFVMGDNRPDSLDSRDPRVGFVDLEIIRGRAVAIYWPLNKIRLIKR